MFIPSDPYEIHKKTIMGRIITLRDYRKTKEYDKIFNYALKNWKVLCIKATYKYSGCISISQQLINKFHCPECVANEIANSISISKAIG